LEILMERTLNIEGEDRSGLGWRHKLKKITYWYVFLHVCGPISQQHRKQATIALSSIACSFFQVSKCQELKRGAGSMFHTTSSYTGIGLLHEGIFLTKLVNNLSLLAWQNFQLLMLACNLDLICMHQFTTLHIKTMWWHG